VAQVSLLRPGFLGSDLFYRNTHRIIDSITTGQCHNQIAAGVETALSCMLGRMAGYEKREVTWENLLAHGETYKLGMNLDQFA
jgi:myo-inositol 2-dehydrogenase / D-chiro-inositol 1-dehydrogenase